MADLPHDRIYILAIISPIYFGYARASRQGRVASLAESVGSDLVAAILIVALSLLMLPIGAVVLKGVVQLFGKRLTVRKLINLTGYATVPRLMVAIPASIYFMALSEESRAEVLSGQFPPIFLVFTVVGGAALVYALVLTIMGIVWSPGAEASLNGTRRST